MPHVLEMVIFYRDLPKGGIPGALNQTAIIPSSQDIDALKLDLGREIKLLQNTNRYEYYYVTVKIRKANGLPAYRCIIPKTPF